jgi:hypothetical protein
MGVFSHKYTEEGYYTEDEMGNLTKANTADEILDILQSGNGFYSDGYGLTIVNGVKKGKRKRIEGGDFGNKY